MSTRQIFADVGLLRPSEGVPLVLKGDHVSYSKNAKRSAYIGDLVVDLSNVVTGSESWVSFSADYRAALPHLNAPDFPAVIFRMAHKYFSPEVSTIIAKSFEASQGLSTAEVAFLNVFFGCVDACRLYASAGKVSPLFSKGVKLEAVLTLGDSGEVVTAYLAKRPEAIVGFHIFKLKEMGLHPKRCAMCSRWFFPSARSDEIYCKNEYKNGRSCADIAFEIKSKDDPFYSEYRKAYKTMSARYSRMQTDQKPEAWKKWRLAANIKREEFKSTGDLDGFKRWLEESKK